MPNLQVQVCTPVDILVEGTLDLSISKRLLRHTGLIPGRVFGQTGKTDVVSRLPRYNAAARYSPWFALCDLNGDAECAPLYKTQVLPNPSPWMVFRIAVREVEAWLLADRKNFSAFLGVRMADLPMRAERVHNPKETVVRIARRSRYRRIREEIIPRAGSGATVGPGYTGTLAEFVGHPEQVRWDPAEAASRAPSLSSCLSALERLSGSVG